MEIFQMKEKSGQMCPKCNTEMIFWNNRHHTCPNCEDWPPLEFRINPEKIAQVEETLKSKN